MESSGHSVTGMNVFAPRPSNGRVWVWSIGLGTLALFAIPMALARDEMPVALGIFLVLTALVSAGPVLVVAWYTSSMQYRLTERELHLSFGPLMNDRIPYGDIRSVTKRDRLRNSPLASFRFPGLALFHVDYIDMGRLRMCATSASREILILETDTKRYGITPEREREFLTALGPRLNDPTIIDVDLAGGTRRHGAHAGFEGNDVPTD